MNARGTVFRLCFSATIWLCLLAFVGAQVHAQYLPPTNGLVGWWRAEGNGGDSTGNGHNGTLLNGGGYDTGKFDQAFSFLGNPNRLFVPDSPDLNLTNSLSIGAWIYAKADCWGVLERATASFAAYSLSFGLTGQLSFAISSQTAREELRFPIGYNQWKQVTATLDGATGDMCLYIDGLLVANRLTTVRAAYLDPSAQPALGIGNTPYGGGFPFVGLIDEVVLYSRALSPAEVQGLAQTPALRIAHIGTNVSLAWPEWASGFDLQESASPASPWTNVGINPAPTNGENLLSLPLSSGPRFYRLYHP